MTPDAYALQLKQLLPRGAVWLLEASSFITKTLLGISGELSRVDGRGDDLVEETDPRTANETIADWEKMLSLPDDIVTVIPATLSARQQAVTQKYVSRGGQSNAYFVSLAALCGYTVTVTNYNSQLSVAGVMQSGMQLCGVAAAYALLVKVSATAGTALTHTQFEAVIRHATHSHISVGFKYL